MELNATALTTTDTNGSTDCSLHMRDSIDYAHLGIVRARSARAQPLGLPAPLDFPAFHLAASGNSLRTEIERKEKIMITIKLGGRSDAVQIVQTLLNSYVTPLSNLREDGDFGRELSQAVCMSELIGGWQSNQAYLL